MNGSPTPPTLQFSTLGLRTHAHLLGWVGGCERGSIAPSPRFQVLSHHPAVTWGSASFFGYLFPDCIPVSKRGRDVCVCVCGRAPPVCECVCLYHCMCMGGALMGDLINGNERTELKINWSIVKQTGINNPLDVICGFCGGGGGAEEEHPPPNIFFFAAPPPPAFGAAEKRLWSD